MAWCVLSAEPFVEHGEEVTVIDLSTVSPLGGSETWTFSTVEKLAVEDREEAERAMYQLIRLDERYAPGVLPILARVEDGAVAAVSGWNLVGDGEAWARGIAEVLSVPFEPGEDA